MGTVQKMKASKYEYTMELLSAMASENIAKKMHLSKIKAFDRFMKSETARMLFDDEYLLWQNGPDYIAAEYYREQQAAKKHEGRA